MNGVWVQPDIRDSIVDFVNYWHGRTELLVKDLVKRIGLRPDKFNEWRKRYGKVNEHNSSIPRDFWLEESEKEAIITYYLEHPQEGYRRITYMMLDDDIVAVSPSSVYRVLVSAGIIRKWNNETTKKGTGFIQPINPHDHWHIDVSYINICGTFCYLCSILDGYSRFIVHWEIHESMTEARIEVIIQRGKEKYLYVHPRIISDNGPQFIARDFKEFIRIIGMTHVRTSPYYPQSNGKLERWHKTLKHESIRPNCPLNIEDARRIVGEYVEQYNNKRLHSAIGYITPGDKMNGREEEIFQQRDDKLFMARERRRANRREIEKVIM